MRVSLILFIYLACACCLGADEHLRRRQVDDRNWHLSRCEIGCGTDFRDCLTRRGHAPGACAQAHADCERACK